MPVGNENPERSELPPARATVLYVFRMMAAEELEMNAGEMTTIATPGEFESRLVIVARAPVYGILPE